jgi:hypothetical protein
MARPAIAAAMIAALDDIGLEERTPKPEPVTVTRS